LLHGSNKQTYKTIRVESLLAFKKLMNNFFRGIIAAWGAKKLGGGCLSTIIIFAVIYMLLGKCNQKTRASVQPVADKAPVAMCR
jgi:hypothetical protein